MDPTSLTEEELKMAYDALELFQTGQEEELSEYNHTILHHPDSPPSLQLCIQSRDSLAEQVKVGKSMMVKIGRMLTDASPTHRPSGLSTESGPKNVYGRVEKNATTRIATEVVENGIQDVMTNLMIMFVNRRPQEEITEEYKKILLERGAAVYSGALEAFSHHSGLAEDQASSFLEDDISPEVKAHVKELLGLREIFRSAGAEHSKIHREGGHCPNCHNHH